MYKRQLLCSEDVDEFCLQIMHDYKEKEFKNINSGDLGLETEEEKKIIHERLMAKYLVAGFVTVTTFSVIVAGIFVKFI